MLIVIATWKHGYAANEAAWNVLSSGGKAVDAVEKGINVAELDPEVQTVGYGCYPDRDGTITLDASIMDGEGNCGAVTYLQNIKTPVSVARKVMEDTPHVMLSGAGALKFAIDKGFKETSLLTDFSKNSWEKWKSEKSDKPVDVHNHDTISMLAIDGNDNLSGACSTGGMAFKQHGRVGDSPIIGAGLFVDNDIGAAAGTGFGEVIMKTVGSYAIVEQMRQGLSPQAACEKIIANTKTKIPNIDEMPVYYIALNKKGEIGACGTKQGFEYALYNSDNGNRLIEANII